MPDFQSKSVQFLFKITLLLISISLLVQIMISWQSIIVPLVASAFLSFLLKPMVTWLEKKGIPRILASLAGLISIFLFISGVLYFFYSQIKNFDEDFDGIKKRITDFEAGLPEFLRPESIDISLESVFSYIQENLSSIFDGIINVAGSLTLIYLIPVYVILMLHYRDFLFTFLIKVVSKSNAGDDSLEKLIVNIRNVIQNYISGMFFVICILFVLNSLALIILDIRHAFLFAAFAAILNIIPFVGPLVGSALPIAFALLTKDSLLTPLAVFAAFVIIQSIESSIITPNIVGRNVSINPLVTLITLFVGAKIWGVVGMILFIPMVAVIKEIFMQIDGLQPYAYVLGTPEKEKKDKPRSRKKLWIRIKSIFKKE
ncbi:MAG: AI-2E family transporter [Cyclobacteriaceae bacterium]|nr:AI-2E family transporter [Cyclobacteriaceae bacterium]